MWGTKPFPYLKHIAGIAIDHESRPPILGIALESGDANSAGVVIRLPHKMEIAMGCLGVVVLRN